MIVITTRQAHVAAAILAQLVPPTNQGHIFRSAKSLAKAANVPEVEVAVTAQSLGLVQKRRRSDGSLLYGIECAVNDCPDVAAPVLAPTGDEKYAVQKMIVHNALTNRRWSKRTLTRLMALADVDRNLLADILGDLGAVMDRDDGLAYYTGGVSASL